MHLKEVDYSQNRTEKQSLLHYMKLRGRGPEVIKLFSCSTQLSMKLALLINLKLLIIGNSLLLNIAEHENFPANKYENTNYYYLLAEEISCLAELSMKKVL